MKIIDSLNAILQSSVLILRSYEEATSIRSILKERYELYIKVKQEAPKLLISFNVLKVPTDNFNYKENAELRILEFVKEGGLKDYE